MLRLAAAPSLSDRSGLTRPHTQLSVALGPSNFPLLGYPQCDASARLSGGDARVPLGLNAATTEHGPVSSHGLGVSSVSSGYKKRASSNLTLAERGRPSGARGSNRQNGRFCQVLADFRGHPHDRVRPFLNLTCCFTPYSGFGLLLHVRDHPDKIP
jgi:hypothetical protein